MSWDWCHYIDYVRCQRKSECCCDGGLEHIWDSLDQDLFHAGRFVAKGKSGYVPEKQPSKRKHCVCKQQSGAVCGSCFGFKTAVTTVQWVILKTLWISGMIIMTIEIALYTGHTQGEK